MLGSPGTVGSSSKVFLVCFPREEPLWPWHAPWLAHRLRNKLPNWFKAHCCKGSRVGGERNIQGLAAQCPGGSVLLGDALSCSDPSFGDVLAPQGAALIPGCTPRSPCPALILLKPLLEPSPHSFLIPLEYSSRFPWPFSTAIELLPAGAVPRSLAPALGGSEQESRGGWPGAAFSAGVTGDAHTNDPRVLFPLCRTKHGRGSQHSTFGAFRTPEC